MSGSGTPWFWKQRRLKTASERYQERRARRCQELTSAAGFPVTVDQIADRDNLYACYQELRASHGQVAGIDQVTYADLTSSDAGTTLSHLSAQLLAGTYRPRPTISVQIPKPGTHQTRTLRVGVLCDRVVGLALHRAMERIWEQVFLDGSWGFRPGRGVWGTLAALEGRMVAHERWVLAIDDVKTAFDTVPVDAVLACHRQVLDAIVLPQQTKQEGTQAQDQKERLLHLLDVVLRGSDPARSRGIDQGANYSPTALNVLPGAFPFLQLRRRGNMASCSSPTLAFPSEGLP